LLSLPEDGRVSSEERSERWFSRFQTRPGRLRPGPKRRRDSSGISNASLAASSLLRRSASFSKASGAILPLEISVVEKAFVPAPLTAYAGFDKIE